MKKAQQSSVLCPPGDTKLAHISVSAGSGWAENRSGGRVVYTELLNRWLRHRGIGAKLQRFGRRI